MYSLFFHYQCVGRSGIHVWSCIGKCQRNGWVDWRWMGSLVSREPINHEDLVNVGKLQQVFLWKFHASVLWNGEWVVSGLVLCGFMFVHRLLITSWFQSLLQRILILYQKFWIKSKLKCSWLVERGPCESSLGPFESSRCKYFMLRTDIISRQFSDFSKTFIVFHCSLK